MSFLPGTASPGLAVPGAVTPGRAGSAAPASTLTGTGSITGITGPAGFATLAGTGSLAAAVTLSAPGTALTGTGSVGPPPAVLGIVPGAASPGLAVPGGVSPGVACTVLPAPTYFDRTDMVYSSEIYWQHLISGGSPIISSDATAQANAATLGIRGIRCQGVNIPGTLGGTQSGGASYSVVNWTKALNLITSTLGCVPAPVGLPPTGTQNWTGGTDVIASSSGLSALGYQFWQWLVTNSIAYTQLFEVCNEPTNYGSAFGCTTVQNYFSMFWVNVPTLKAWARAQGYPPIYVGGPALSGGESFKISGLQTFLQLCLANYNNPPTGTQAADWIPDFVSAHFYEGGGTNSSPAALTTTGTDLDGLRTWILNNIPPQFDIRIVISEYNYAIQANAGTDYMNQSVMNTFYADFFAMCNALSTDGDQRVWLANEFTIESSGTNLFLLNADSSVGIPGIAFAAQATAVPVQAATVWSPVPGATILGGAPPSAALTGTGSLVGSVIQPVQGTILAGTGSVTPLPATQQVQGTILAGAGSLAALVIRSPVAILAGAGSLAATGRSVMAAVDITVFIGPTVTRAQAATVTVASRAQVSAAGGVQDDGTEAGGVQDDGTETGLTVVNRSS